MIRKLLTSAFVWALAASAALAQPAPQFGVIQGYAPKQTFRAISAALTIAATPTDFFCIAGAASKTIKLNRIEINGLISTAVNVPVALLRRTSLDTGGTAASTTANPANTIGKMDTTNGAATATLIAYTANPTVNDSSPTYLAAAPLQLQATTAVGGPVVFDFTNNSANLQQQPTIRNGQTTQQICLNGMSTAVTLTGNSLFITIEWSEE